jgi:hypothetical protein
MQLYGVRNLTMGLTTLGVWYSGDRRALGFALLAGFPNALIDGFVSRWQIGGGEWAHWAFVPLGLGLAAGVLGWL